MGSGATPHVLIVGAGPAYLERRQIMNIAEPTAALGHRALRVVPQPQLLRLMLTEAQASPHFTFRSGLTVRDVIRDGEHVRGVRASTPAGEQDLYGDLTIVATVAHPS